MSKTSGILVTIAFAFGICASFGPAAATSCEKGVKTGKQYKVRGTGIALRTAPGSNSQRIVNRKLSRITGDTRYATIDSSVTVREACRYKGWSKVAVVKPDWLAKSHRGWVLSRVLVGADERKKSGFSASDFRFDRKTAPYKDIIIRGVNRIARQDPRCKEIDPLSAYISGKKGSRANPVFFVTCGSAATAVNVYFSKSDVENNKKFAAPVHIRRSTAVRLCERFVKTKAALPSSVKFSKFWSLAVHDHPNGRTTVMSKVKAKNGFGIEQEYKVRCLLDSSGLIEGTINRTG